MDTKTGKKVASKFNVQVLNYYWPEIFKTCLIFNFLINTKKMKNKRENKKFSNENSSLQTRKWSFAKKKG